MALTSWGVARFFSAAVLVTLGLAGCGGGSSTAPSLSGVAAVGVPIVAGTVKVTCSGGSAQTSTSSTGGWTVSVSGLTLPCAVQVSGGTVGNAANTTPYHSIALTTGTVNVTPLTDLVVAQMLGTAPATWFSSPVFSNVSASALAAALSAVNTNLGIGGTLGSVDPLTATFLAQNGDKIDDVLEAIKAALANLAKTHADLLAAAQSNNYGTLSGFGASFTSSYSNLANTASAGSTTCTSGQTRFVFSANVNVSSTFSEGQSVCFTASTTTLSFSGKTLTNPVQNTVVQAPFAAYKFTDATDSYAYQVIFNAGNLYEINLEVGSSFAGQFAAPAP